MVGGTSAAAPAWAALIALTNASARCAGTPIGFANPALYNAAATAYSSDFNDVTSGNNDMTGSNGGLFPAGPGYDMATGLGSPNATALAQTLCTDAITLTNPGQQRTTVKTPVSLQIKAADTRSQAVTYAATGLPIGLTINSSTGKITGQPKRIGNSTGDGHRLRRGRHDHARRRSSGSSRAPPRSRTCRCHEWARRSRGCRSS